MGFIVLVGICFVIIPESDNKQIIGVKNDL